MTTGPYVLISSFTACDPNRTVAPLIERSGYTAIGTVCNLAARLCAEAKNGQILIVQRVARRRRGIDEAG